MDLNKQPDSVKTINSAVRIGRFVSGIIISLFFIAFTIFFITLAPSSPIPYVMLACGILFMFLLIVIFIRQSKTPTASDNAAHGKLTFANFTDDSVSYAAPTNTSTTPIAHGTVKAWLAPIIHSGVTSFSILGKATYTRQENTLLLTDNAIIGLQIPPTKDSTSDSVLGSVVSFMPTDAATKNLLTSTLDRDSVRETVTSEIATNSVEALMQKYYSFTVPFSEILTIEYRQIGGIHVQTRSLGDFNWTCDTEKDREFMEILRSSGLPVVLR